MRVGLSLYIQNACIVEQVNAYAAARMNNFAIFEQDAYVHNAFVAFEEGDIAGLGLRKAIEHAPLFGLLISVAQQAVAGHFKDQLHEAGAVNAEGATPTPLVGGMQKLPGSLHHKAAAFRILCVVNFALKVIMLTGEVELTVLVKRQGAAYGDGEPPPVVVQEMADIGHHRCRVSLQAQIFFFGDGSQLQQVYPAYVSVEDMLDAEPFFVVRHFKNRDNIAKQQLRYLFASVCRLSSQGHHAERAGSIFEGWRLEYFCILMFSKSSIKLFCE